MGVAAVKGTYEGHVQITDKDKPSRYGLALEASGSSGTVRGTGSVELDETQDGTSIRWTADAQVSGAIASVGQRLIGGVARMVADEFFKCIERQIGETSATEGVPAQRP
jgi:carbon monoxide dehydrogenase subunit G